MRVAASCCVDVLLENGGKKEECGLSEATPLEIGQKVKTWMQPGLARGQWYNIIYSIYSSATGANATLDYIQVHNLRTVISKENDPSTKNSYSGTQDGLLSSGLQVLSNQYGCPLHQQKPMGFKWVLLYIHRHTGISTDNRFHCFDNINHSSQ